MADMYLHIFPPFISFSLVTGIKSYYQTCWQLLHTSLHSLSTFFSFMMEERKEIILNPLVTSSPLLGLWSSSPFSFALFQMRGDRLTICTVQLYFSCSLAWNQPSFFISLPLHDPVSKTVFCTSLPFSSLNPCSLWVSMAYGPSLSTPLQSFFALRRLHFVPYPLPKSAFHSGFCLPPFLFSALFGPCCQFLDSAIVRWFQLRSMRVRNHTLSSNTIKRTTVSSDLASKMLFSSVSQIEKNPL